MAQKNVTAPRLPAVTPAYDPVVFNQLFNILRLYFAQLDNAGPMAASSQFDGADVVSGLSFAPNVGTATPSLPTEANLANLRVGDIYYDTSANNVLKVKT
jgi:hypothetical protein